MYNDEICCSECGGEGIIVTCYDDICVGIGHCIHGDGEVVCPECNGEGVVFAYDDDNDDDWEMVEAEHGN